MITKVKSHQLQLLTIPPHPFNSRCKLNSGTEITKVYEAMNSIQFAPFSIFPEFVKGGGGHHSGDGDDKGVPSGDITLIVSVVETYEDNQSYSSYEEFLDDLFDAMDAMGGG